MAGVNLSGPTRAHMKATSSKTIFTARANTDGPMVECTTDNGLTIKWKDKAPLHGAMEGAMLVAMRMIKSMDMVHSSGPMAVSILVSGAKANNTAKAYTSKKVKKGRVSGKWAKELNGLRRLPSKPTEQPSKYETILLSDINFIDSYIYIS